MRRFLLFCLLFSLAASAHGTWEEKWNRGKDKPDSRPQPSFYSETDFWANIWMGYSFCSLEDVRKSTTDWKSQLSGAGTTTAQADVDGLNLGLEGGWLFDGLNGLSASFENIQVSQTSYTFSAASVNIYSDLQPNLYSVSLNFYHFIDQKPGDQVYLCVGAGYYISSVSFVEWQTVNGNRSSNISGYWGDGVPGGTVGAGARINAGKSFGIQLDARGRYANFPRVTTPYWDSGTQQNYISALAVNPSGLIVQEPVGSVGSGNNQDHFLDIDFSGFDLNVGIFYHF